jgi:serine/threonine protein kinase/predicted Zn-dependent protease
MKVPQTHLSSGDVLAGKYRIVEGIGKGGMGMIYKAQDIKLERPVAIKLLPSDLTLDPEARQRFTQEARTASALDHASICTIYEVDETEDGRMFIAMAYYPGETLKERIGRGPLGIKESIDIAIQIARGLARAHEAGIVHRDVKPANIIITDHGDVRILDFGLAKLAGEMGLTKAGIAMGTVLYMSPEQARGEDVDQRTDIWSLGAVLYEMLTGEIPFKGDRDQAVIYAILNREPPPFTAIRSDVPAELERIVRTALCKSPECRYQHADRMLSDLTNLRNRMRTAATTEPIEIASAPPPKPIAVISFENQTGDEAYDYLRKAIPNLLITSLEQSKYLRVVTWERMHDLLKQLGKDQVDAIDRDLGFELCDKEDVQTIVVGSFVKAGNMFATDAKVLDVGTKTLLNSASARGQGVDSILQSQIDELSRQISTGLGVMNGSTKARGLPIAEVTTASMEAYDIFLKGRELYEKLYNDEAIRFLTRAVELDPDFAVAYFYLARTYNRLRELKAERQAYEKAKGASEKATKKERLYIEAGYARAIEQDETKRFRILKEITENYPDEKRAHHFLASHYRARGQLYQAVEEYKKVLDLDPNFGWAMNELAYMYADVEDFEQAIEYLSRYAAACPGEANPLDSMGEMYFRLGRLDDAIAKYKEAIDANPDFYYAYWEIGYVYALMENYDKALDWTGKFVERSPSQGTRESGLVWKCFYHYWLGDYDKALEAAQKTEDAADAAGSRLWKTEADRMRGWIHFDRGDLDLSRRYFDACLEAVRSDPAEYVPISTSFSLGLVEETNKVAAAHSFALALIDLREDKIDSARGRLEEIRSVLSGHYDLLHGELLLAEGNPDKAITACEKSPPWKIPYMSDRDSMLAYNLPALKDVLARAFVEKGDLGRAIAEYERLTSVGADSHDRQMVHPLYHYRLAVLYVRKNDPARAIEQYRRFLTLWKHADPDLQEIQDARQSLARLEQSM